MDIFIHTVPLHLIHSIRFFFEYPKMSCAQWQKAQVFIYFRSRIIEETVIRTNYLEKAFTVVNPTIGGAKPPLEMEILGRKVSYDLLLDERVFPAKFHCICSYRVQMHNEQTHKQTFFFVYVGGQCWITSNLRLA
jgi:hypothetical protein